jgi:DNA-binding MarR family transcriptional regulator
LQQSGLANLPLATIHHMVLKLEEKGLINRIPGQAKYFERAVLNLEFN